MYAVRELMLDLLQAYTDISISTHMCGPPPPTHTIHIAFFFEDRILISKLNYLHIIMHLPTRLSNDSVDKEYFRRLAGLCLDYCLELDSK